jgi:hypothetical protein
MKRKIESNREYFDSSSDKTSERQKRLVFISSYKPTEGVSEIL